jgi:hypothetical protein
MNAALSFSSPAPLIDPCTIAPEDWQYLGDLLPRILPISPANDPLQESGVYPALPKGCVTCRKPLSQTEASQARRRRFGRDECFLCFLRAAPEATGVDTQAERFDWTFLSTEVSQHACSSCRVGLRSGEGSRCEACTSSGTPKVHTRGPSHFDLGVPDGLPSNWISPDRKRRSRAKEKTQTPRIDVRLTDSEERWALRQLRKYPVRRTYLEYDSQCLSCCPSCGGPVLVRLSPEDCHDEPRWAWGWGTCRCSWREGNRPCRCNWASEVWFELVHPPKNIEQPRNLKERFDRAIWRAENKMRSWQNNSAPSDPYLVEE